MLRPTFIGYKTATSALNVNQSMLDVVGQNISNINTEGYTRQRLDINSVAFGSSNVKYGMTGVVIGQGVKANGTSQFRDEFLDLRYRIEAAKSGSQQVQSEALSDLENIMDEILTDKLNDQFSDLLEQLQELTKSPSDPVVEGVVRTSAEMLTQMLNDYSQRIDTVRDNQMDYLNDGAIVEVNQLLDNIAKLNQQIKEDNISGNPALELNDQRNLLIDELSGYLNIEVDVTSESIGGGRSVDLISIKLSDTDIKLIDDNQRLKLEAVEDSATGQVKINTIINDPDDPYDFDDSSGTKLLTDISSSITGGQINGYLQFLNGKGDYAAASPTGAFEDSKGVLYYQNMLDTLASEFAEVMNETNRVPAGYDADGNVTSWTEKPLFTARDVIDPLTGEESYKPADITALNIKISDAWADETGSYITNTIVQQTGDDNTGATDNIIRMISKFSSEEKFTTINDPDPSAGEGLFEGTFQEFLTYTITRLNLQTDDVQTSYDTYSETQYQLDYARSSMSSVDLNEEGVNLLQYSKSYNAAARLMTTLDEMLDTLINRMGV